MHTIFALASGAGRAGVAVFRISGPQSLQALAAITATSSPKPRHAHLRILRDPATGEPIDSALTLWFPAPHSFTGEDVVELHTHGSMAVIRDITRILSAIPGLRLAEPGEFSRRAFENGKMDLTQAEGLADLIDAATSAQRRQALRQMDGELTRLYESWRAQLVHVLAHIEAYVDFPDEDLPETLEREIDMKVRQLHDALEKHLSDARGKHLREGVYVAIIGAPNVGKSSLLNALSQREAAIVSPEAGTTRDAIEVHLEISGVPVTLCDTAGLRSTENAVEAEGIRRARARAHHADITLCMFDAGQEPDTETLSLIDNTSLVLLNKVDATPHIPAALPTPFLRLSLASGEGLEGLLEALSRHVGAMAGAGATPVFTRERHRAALQSCCNACTRFLAGGSTQNSIECRAEDLRAAAQALGSITGRIGIDELMDEIFSSFCIGK